jgi:hypothetical protein
MLESQTEVFILESYFSALYDHDIHSLHREYYDPEIIKFLCEIVFFVGLFVT